MDILKEFLESSTIHGLSYISTSRSKRAKSVWFFCILVSFSIAIFLIGKTTKEIEDDPFSTAITTHPIDELDFPLITICPPEGTNTALNHGLKKARQPLTQKQREQLKNATKRIFIQEPFLDFASFFVNVANKGNIKKMCESAQSIPKPLSSSGLEIRTNALNGSFMSPDYEGKATAQARTKVHYIIELPSNGTFDLQMRLDGEGRLEYKRGSLFQYVPNKLSFDLAMAQCSLQGGQLASLHSIEELGEAVKVADPNSLVQWGAWLGARFDEKQEKWEWLDGSSWDWESWDEGQPNRTCGRECGDCLRLNTTSWKLRTFRCSRSTNFFCRIPPAVLHRDTEEGVAFNFSNATSLNFQLWWTPPKYSGKYSRFSMNWTISTETMNGQSVGDIYNTVLVQMVNLVREANKINMTTAALKLEVIRIKAKMIEDGEYLIDKWCHLDRVRENMLILNTQTWRIEAGLGVNIKERDVIHPETTDEEFETGFDIFSSLIFCPEELQLLYQFHMELLDNKNTQTILQTTVNNIKSGKMKDESNIEYVKSFFFELDSIISTDLGKVVLALSRKRDFQQLLKDNMPYIKTLDDAAIQNCMKDNNCQSLSDAIQDLGENYFIDLKHL